MTTEELRFCFRMIAAAWPHYKALPETFHLGERLLGPMDARAVAAAIEQFSLEGREFAPPLGLVARRAHELLAEINGETVPDAHRAMAEVYDRIARVGIYGTPSWSHPAIGATVEAMGGWEATCGDDNPEAYRAHFLRLYETMRARVEREKLVAPSLRDLREAMAGATRALPPAEDDEPVYVPGPGERLIDREALLEALRSTEVGPRRGRLDALTRGVSATAHDFGDHSLCMLDCPDRPATA